MTRVGVLLRRVLLVVVGVALAAYAAQVTHDFYSYVDSSIFVSVDDSEANIAYALATEGRYGFPASPVLAGQDRTRWQFNYGPWYFYLAGALSWLFGFSLTLVRSIHLWGILGMIGLAAWHFAGRDRMAATLLFGLGLLYCFEASHWPMARPDIMVPVFAVVLVMAGGTGTQRMGAAPWFVAGLAAACGAFTHLIAFSLVPSACVLFAVAAALELAERTDRREAWRAVWRAALGFAAGGLLGAAMFYASFGFQFGVQYQFLTAYRELTASPVSFSTALGHHLAYAFGYLSTAARTGVWAGFAVAWILLLASWFTARADRRLVFAYLLPPAVVWAGYLASSGYYTNYHQGYALLHQIMALWLGAALAWLALWSVRVRFPTTGAVIGMVVLIVLGVQTVRQFQWQRSGESWKLQRTATWVPFTEYYNRVLQAMPARATAWGSVILGLEAPDRIQLVQWADVAGLFTRMAPADRAPLTPDYLVWAYPEVRDNMLSVTRGAESLLFRTAQLLADTEMRVVSLVAGAPYGVTRTYARRVGPPDESRPMPTVSVFDAARRRWLTRVGAPLATTFATIPPVTLNIGYEPSPPPSVPANSVVADLPADRYLLRVDVRPGSGPGRRRLLAATSAGMVRQTMGEAGPDGDFVSYLAPDTHAYMLAVHTGGALYISQFDDGVAPAINSVVAYPIIGLLNPAEQPRMTRDLPKLAGWSAVPGVEIQPAGEAVRVIGDASAGGYQLVSPLIPAHENNRITVRVPHRVERGRVCAGALNGNAGAWLVAPDSVRAELSFSVDATQGFHVVLANCRETAGGDRSEFVVWDGDYLDDPVGTSYADRVVAAALNPGAKLNERAGPEVRTVPAGLVLLKSVVEGPVERLTPEDLDYRSPLVAYDGGVWTLTGKAEGPFTYALQSKPRRLDSNSRLLISGSAIQGGITVGLLRDNQWAAQLNVTDPGDFTAVIAPPMRGTYTIVLAHNLPQSLDTSIQIKRFGMLPSK